jgi:hypothetical protein
MCLSRCASQVSCTADLGRYLILDVIAKAVFAFVLLTGKANGNGDREGLLSARAATKR